MMNTLYIIRQFLSTRVELLEYNFIAILLILASAFKTPDKHLTYGIFAVSLIILFFSVVWLIRKKSVKIFPLSLIFFVFFIFWIVEQLCREPLPLHEQMKIYSLYLLFFIYSQNSFERQGLKLFYFVCSLFGVCMSLWGIFQYLGVAEGYYRPILVTGSFENPAGFAAFLSALFPSACFFVKEPNKMLKMWGKSVCLLIILVVILSKSRTGVLALFIICILCYYKHLCVLWKKFNFKKNIVLGVWLIGILLFLILYLWKKDSANGRILIWFCSCKMFLEHWLVGAGGGSFIAKYMLYQADYFQQHPDSVFSILADDVRHPFNEYLKILVEYGIVGIGFICCIIMGIVKIFKVNGANQDLQPVFYSMLAIAFFAFFSYPLFYLGVNVILLLNISIIVSYSKKVWNIKKRVFVILMKGVCALYVFFLFISAIEWFKTEIRWRKVANLALSGETIKVLPCYIEIYELMKHNGSFLYNYGAELYQVGKYEDSIKVLEECSVYFNSVDLQMLFANNYAQVGMSCEVERCLKRAVNMCPIRYIPLYKLFQFYSEIGNKNKAIEVGYRILNKPMKIESSLIECIKIDVKKYILANEVEGK